MTRKARITQMKLMRLKLLNDIESARGILEKLEDSERKAKDKNAKISTKEVKNNKDLKST